MALRGVIPVAITPMNEDGSPDQQGTERFVEFELKHPIGGFWALGSAGESWLMKPEHRIEFGRMFAKAVNGRVPIIMGVADDIMDNIFTFMDEFADLHVDGYHAIPQDTHLNESAVIRFYNILAERSPKPIWLYHNPWRGATLTVNAVKELSQHDNIAGMKAGGFATSAYLGFAGFDSDEFQSMGAGAGQMLMCLSTGMRAQTASPASCFPDRLCRVFSLWDQGKVKEAIAAQRDFNKLWSQIPVASENSETSAHEKAILEILGICKRHVGSYFRPMNDEEMKKTKQVLEQAGYC